MTFKKDTIAHKIMYLLMMCGELPYASMDILNVNAESIRKTIQRLEKEQYIVVTKKDDIKRIKVNNFNHMKKNYIATMPNGIEEYYLKNNASLVKKSDKQKVARMHRTAEVIMMMHETSIEIFNKPSIEEAESITINQKVYYTSRELKSTESKEEGCDKKIVFTRINGLNVSPGGIYAIYALNKAMIEWKQHGEIKAQNAMSLLINKTYEPFHGAERKYQLKSCIVFTREYMVGYEILVNREVNTKAPLLSIDGTYENMYLIPTTKDGQKILGMMQCSNWKQKLIDLLIDRSEQTNEYCNVDCDGIEKLNDTEVYTLIFFEGNLPRLKRFYQSAKLTKNRYRIYCFKHQAEMLKLYTRGQVDIQAYEIETVEKYFYENT